MEIDHAHTWSLSVGLSSRSSMRERIGDGEPVGAELELWSKLDARTRATCGAGLRTPLPMPRP